MKAIGTSTNEKRRTFRSGANHFGAEKNYFFFATFLAAAFFGAAFFAAVLAGALAGALAAAFFGAVFVAIVFVSHASKRFDSYAQTF